MSDRPTNNHTSVQAWTADNVCPICGETKGHSSPAPQGEPIVRCARCGLASRIPQPDAPKYGSFHGAEKDSSSDGDEQSLIASERGAVLAYIAALTDRVSERGRLLVVAPPGHPFVAESRGHGFEVASYLSVSEIENRMDLAGGYDAAVIIGQLGESVAPIRLLQQTHKALRREGVLLLALPSLNSRFSASQLQGYPPRTRFFFDEQTIQSVLLRSGFARIEIHSGRKRLSALLRVFRSGQMPAEMIVTACKSDLRERPLCSVVLPAYNEGRTFSTLMDRLLAKSIPGVDKEIIVVESNSKDGTREAALDFAKYPEVRLVLQDGPKGKGNAVREGLEQAQGDVALIQDADLEYDVNDYDKLIEPILTYRTAFVLGARRGDNLTLRKFAGQPFLTVLANLAHIFFTTLLNVLYGQRMKDPLTMFKVFRRDCLYGLEFECNGFNFDHELLIKLIRKGYNPLEIPVNYESRSFKEGKKTRIFRDPLTWIWADFKYRFCPLFPRKRP